MAGSGGGHDPFVRDPPPSVNHVQLPQSRGNSRGFRREPFPASVRVTPVYVPCGAGCLLIAPVIGMKNTPMSRREWILPASSLV